MNSVLLLDSSWKQQHIWKSLTDIHANKWNNNVRPVANLLLYYWESATVTAKLYIHSDKTMK